MNSNLWIGVWATDHGESIPMSNDILYKRDDEYDYDGMIYCSEKKKKSKQNRNAWGDS